MIRRTLIGQYRNFVSRLMHEKVAVSASFWSRSVLVQEKADSLIPRRAMSLNSNHNLIYDDIVKLSSKNEIILIDVREPAEIQESGVLPGSTNIPLSEVPSALNLDESAFKQKYGIEKPKEDSPIVFSCRSGTRSNMALQKALALGFSHSRHYTGGWLDWEKNTKQ